MSEQQGEIQSEADITEETIGKNPVVEYINERIGVGVSLLTLERKTRFRRLVEALIVVILAAGFVFWVVLFVPWLFS